MADFDLKEPFLSRRDCVTSVIQSEAGSSWQDAAESLFLVPPTDVFFSADSFLPPDCRAIAYHSATSIKTKAVQT